MNPCKYIYLILSFCILTGCAALFTEQEYVLIDKPVTEKSEFYGVIFSMPEIANVRKIVFLGRGKVQNLEIHIRDNRKRWKPYKKIPGAITFPHEVMLIAKTDAVKIIQQSVRGTGHIETVQFYRIVDKVKK